MKNILVLIENDICFRHFMMNDTFQKLCENFNVKFVFPEEKNKRISSCKIKNQYFNSEVTRLFQNKIRVMIWKYLLYIDQIRFRFGRQSKVIRKQRMFTLGWKAYLIFKILGLPIIWFFVKKILFNLLKKNEYDELLYLLKSWKPNVIIHPCTLDSIYLNDLIFYTINTESKVLAIMNSWDNPSTKNTVYKKPYKLLVWGKQTSDHAKEYMGLEKQEIEIFGSAQFDLYTKKSKLNKKKFNQIYKVNNETILLYAGSSKGTNEISHLKLIDKAIETGILKNIVVIYRPHPWGGGGYNGKEIIKVKWKHIKIDIDMIAYLKNISNGEETKYLSSYSHTHDLLSNVDCVISPLSTIILESLIHGKPVLCFTPKEKQAKHLNIERDLIHFREIYKNEKILKAFDNNQLIEKIPELAHKSSDKCFKKELIKFSEFFVQKFDKQYKFRLNDLVSNIIK